MVRPVDVVIVGAGPAGAALAARLAARGVEVWCLEAREFPREKPCGDSLNPGAVAALERLGASARVVAESPPRRLRGWRVGSGAGGGFAAEYGHGLEGWGVRRRDLDAALARHAEARGARLLYGVRAVELMRSSDCVTGVVARSARGRVEVPARLVVGADGLRSVVATRLGLVARPPRRRKVGFVAHLEGGARAVDGMGELWLRGKPGGADACCVGVAPLGDGTLNVTCVQAEPAQGFHRRPDWRSILEQFPELAARLRPFRPQGPPLASGPFDRPVRRAFAPGALLAGDAAGYYDPFTGEGVYRALRSAEIAAPLALAYLETRSVAALAEYDRAWRRELRPCRLLERAVEHVVSRPVPFAVAAVLLSVAPAWASALLRWIGDAPAGGGGGGGGGGGAR